MFSSKEFGKTIRRLRIKNGFTLLHLASELYIDQSYLGQIERGVKPPSVYVAVGLANIFKISFNDFHHEHSGDIDNILKNDITMKIKSLSKSEHKFIYQTLKRFYKFRRGDTSA